MNLNFSGRTYEIVHYGVGDDGYIDYDQVRETALEERPRMILAGASAYPRIIHFDRFREIADEVGAFLLTDMAHIAGLVAADVHPSPIPYSEVVTTTTHKTLRGARGGMILCREEFAKKVNSRVFPGLQGGPLMHATAGKELEETLESVGVTCNKNMVPNDPEKPTVTSGVRLGTAAMTTRGMGPDEMREIAEIIARAARGELEGLRERVAALTEAFPLYE